MGGGRGPAEALKLGIGAGTIAAQQRPAIERALAKTLKVWGSGVELALAEFDKLDHLPNRLLLCGGGSSLEMLMHHLSGGDWYKVLPFTKKPKVQHILPEDVIGISDTTGDITDHTFITAMGLLRVGMDTLNSGEAPDQASLKDRFNKALKT